MGSTSLSTQSAEFRSRLKAFVLRSVPGDQDAEDVVQDALLKVYKRIDSVRSSESLTAWVFQIVRNEIAEFHRRRTRTALRTTPLSDSLAATLSDDSAGSQDNEAHAEIARCLASMVDLLPEQARQAIVLTEFEQRTQKEMAESLGLSFSGAKSRVQRARAALKQRLLECCRLEFDRVGHVLRYEPRDGGECAAFCGAS